MPEPRIFSAPTKREMSLAFGQGTPCPYESISSRASTRTKNTTMRRPIAARESGWAKNLARVLAACGVTPNAVSGASVFCAALAMLCLIGAGRSESAAAQVALFLGAALFIQLRLLCNLFDGMLAVEFKKSSALGPLWNDFPDRPADVLILVGCGYSGGVASNFAAWLPALGWAAAALALMTAYARVLGVAVGARETFAGPMAKQHRMAMATFGCVFSALPPLGIWLLRKPPPQGYSLPSAMLAVLLLIVVGCVVTIVRRLKLIARDLQSAASTREEAS